MRVLLLSTYELGHQPLGLARPAADLLAAGHEVRCLDLAVQPLDEDAVHWAGLIGVSTPMHTATRLGVRLAARVRALNPQAHLTFYGLYASLHADVLVPDHGDSAIGGEFEGPLVALADALAVAALAARDPDGGARHASRVEPILGVRTAHHDGGVALGRQQFSLPRRDRLPPLEGYAQVDLGDRRKLTGYVEASRGCAHRCLHCPIAPVYGGRLRVVQQDVVLEDVAQLVRLGAEHITFGDPDFFNGIKHSLRIVEELHAAFPSLTYDATIKVEHLLEHRQHLETLARTGCLFVVSAVEAVDDRVLRYLDKGHTAADVETALILTRAAGLPIRPTFMPFTPWLSLDGYLALLAWVRRQRLIGNIDPVQFAIRMLVPRGSSLLGTAALAPHVGPFDAETFSYRWAHPDPRMDSLQEEVAAAVEAAGCAGDPPAQTFVQIERLAQRLSGGGSSRGVEDDPGTLVRAAFVPRLTETWFC
ncbi:MAG: radical SAM protein [Chloroflexi bacterium]|nr:radical SAM protein [Chloroflexota bacterium]